MEEFCKQRLVREDEGKREEAGFQGFRSDHMIYNCGMRQAYEMAASPPRTGPKGIPLVDVHNQCRYYKA